ncbi:MAG: HEAT repeat domain-containing protein [Deltaproteobacteria bacterium]|nr:HEAT repeat domain-containing protein [Deltaproteobacteria bacterium]
MSLADWLEQRKDRKRLRAIQRHRKAIKNRYGYGDDRAKAVEFFQQLGGKEGHLGLLERFMVMIDKSIKDEDEKQQVFEILVGFGKEVVPAVEDYIHRKDAASVPITWPLKVLDEVCEPAEAVDVIVRALDAVGTDYVREPERKVLLVAQLAEYDDERVVSTLIPFLRDHRDEVQLEALAALVRRADERAREPMLEIMVDDETPVRVRAQIADALQKLRWNVKGYRKKVEAALPEGLSLDRSGRIKGRWVHAPQDVEGQA